MVYVDDMILVKDEVCTGGSRMLEHFVSPFDAEAVTRLRRAGIEFRLRRTPAEFGHGRVDTDCLPRLAVESCGAYGMAAQRSGKVFLKPTYGTVSRYGVIPMACSGEQIGVLADTVAEARALYAILAGHDDKDGTSLPDAPAPALEGTALRVTHEAFPEVKLAQTAWDILFCAEACNNLSRYDGVKFGHRTASYRSIEELYVGSRTEGFTFPTKQVILYGSDVLSKDRYDGCYDKALRVRRVLFDRLSALLETAEVLVCSDVYLPLITGFPALTVCGRQLIGRRLGEAALFAAAETLEKGGAI